MTVFRSAASFQRRLEPKFITFAATSIAARNRPEFQPSLNDGLQVSRAPSQE